jgi:hypothetical protein
MREGSSIAATKAGRVAGRPVHIAEILGRDELTGLAIDDVKKAVLLRIQEDFAFLSVDREIGQDQILVGVVVPGVRGSFLKMPRSSATTEDV